MIVRMGLLQKKPDWSDEAFRRYWLDQHSQLAKQLPGLRGYRQNHVVDSRQIGFSQLWFDDRERMQRGVSSDLGPRLIQDEQHFIGTLHIIAAEATTVVAPPPTQGAVLKRMSLLKRADGMSDERFRHEWTSVHADLVKRMPGVRGYRQNLIVARERVKGSPCSWQELPIDGVVELWFDSIAGIEAAFGSPAGQATMAHGETFLSEVTTFLVQEHVIV